MVKKAAKKAVDKESQGAAGSKKKNNEPVSKKVDNSKDTKDADKEAENKTDKGTSKKTKSTKKKNSKEEIALEQLFEKVSLMEEGAKEWQDKYMRLSAEFDNYRKRTLKEKADLTKQANGDLLKDILPVVDDFDRGRDNIEKAKDIDGVKQGIDLIYNKFIEFLKQSGIKEIEAKEQEFDIDFHEALTKIPAPSEDLKGKVVDVIEKGYMLNDKVIRYAKVVVGE